MGGGEGESLPTEAHQVSVLKPGVTEAVFDRRAGPVKDQAVRKNVFLDILKMYRFRFQLGTVQVYINND